MGQQQLLLIVLGVIIVGIAVVVGISVFTASSTSSNRDAVSGDLLQLSSMAQTYYKKPTAMGGGGNSFVGWVIPASLVTTGNGTYAATVTATNVILVGTGTEKGTDGTTNVKVTTTVTTTGITSVVNN